ncbi:MAG: hypothetical protein M5U33_04895 [Pseudorhodoplanes sp.]|nr:hypothetical protein [Pseudorhodoplanes sp.]
MQRDEHRRLALAPGLDAVLIGPEGVVAEEELRHLDRRIVRRRTGLRSAFRSAGLVVGEHAVLVLQRFGRGLRRRIGRQCGDDLMPGRGLAPRLGERGELRFGFEPGRAGGLRDRRGGGRDRIEHGVHLERGSAAGRRRCGDPGFGGRLRLPKGRRRTAGAAVLRARHGRRRRGFGERPILRDRALLRLLRSGRRRLLRQRLAHLRGLGRRRGLLDRQRLGRLRGPARHQAVTLAAAVDLREHDRRRRLGERIAAAGKPERAGQIDAARIDAGEAVAGKRRDQRADRLRKGEGRGAEGRERRRIGVLAPALRHRRLPRNERRQVLIADRRRHHRQEEDGEAEAPDTSALRPSTRGTHTNTRKHATQRTQHHPPARRAPDEATCLKFE